jgi:hypothetical protein
MGNRIKTTEDIINEVMTPLHKDDILFERSVVIKLMETYSDDKLKSFKEELLNGIKDFDDSIEAFDYIYTILKK